MKWSLTSIIFAASMATGFGLLWVTQPTPLNTARQFDDELGRYLETSTGVIDSRWNSIVIHHTATPRGTMADYDRYMKDVIDQPLDMGWHFLIRREPMGGTGLIEAGRRWRHQEDGYHINSAYHQANSIGVCLVGDFRKMRPTDEQLRALISLVNSLQTICGIPEDKVYLHSDLTPGCDCPGILFPQNGGSGI